ncbi:MAG: T9SS type A sorting domain-containing protein [Bacteroidetes bacterium]|nr:T9SS type A sorting domain-containing protein [Bacteroidota bacterium]
MIKHFTFILCFLSITFLSAQSVPNGGFESWQVGTYEEPVDYKTSNSENKNNGSGFNPINTVKTTDAYSGQYAIKLTTAGSGTDTSIAFFADGNPNSGVFDGGIPYTQTPTGIRFHYKSNIIGTDSAIFLVFFKKNGVNIGNYIYKFSATKTVYTLFNATFSPALPTAPDTMMIACASSNAFSNSGFMVGNMMQIDSVALTGVTSQPGLLNGNFENWVTSSDYKLSGWTLDGDYQRSNDFYSGSYALELQTVEPAFGNNQIRVGRAMTGMPTQSSTLGGTPFSNQVDTLVFFYKYLPADPVDSARFFANFKKNGVFIGNAFKLLPISASYQQVIIPFNTGQAPDTVLFTFESSKWPVQESYIGSDLKIDNFYLKSQKLPIAKFNAPPYGCKGQPVNLTDASYNMANAWGWITPGGTPGSSTAQNPVVIYSTTGTKTITMICSNQFGSSSTVSKTITINSIPQVSSTSTVTPCGGSNEVLTASGANSYTWNTGANTPTISASVSVTTIFTVVGASNGCTNSATGIVVVPGVPRPDICMVTVDSANVYNNIYWNKTDYPMLDSMIIFREVIANTYKRIGAVSKNALSFFVDTARSVGPANGDPNISTYRYKLQIRDTCGSYGQKSLWHNTVYFTHSGGTFFWTNNYMVEGGINPVQTYSLMVCMNPNSSPVYSVVGTTTGNQSTLNDPFYTIYQATADWRVEANLGYSCAATLKPIAGNNILGGAVKSRSNIQNNRAIGFKENTLASSVKLYPNPANSIITLELNLNPEEYKSLDVTITNVLGAVMYAGKMESATKTIDLNGFAKGIYLLNVHGLNGKATFKVVKN